MICPPVADELRSVKQGACAIAVSGWRAAEPVSQVASDLGRARHDA